MLCMRTPIAHVNYNSQSNIGYSWHALQSSKDKGYWWHVPIDHPFFIPFLGLGFNECQTSTTRVQHKPVIKKRTLQFLFETLVKIRGTDTIFYVHTSNFAVPTGNSKRISAGNPLIGQHQTEERQ
ncbi:unnamed protein product [Ilex paraguariensis]|uniref:Uncharacterized protein n=1 Tax=Ilex paraguariensis TaxID=185542 RepID=A0ABC8TQ50_9AQUA